MTVKTLDRSLKVNLKHFLVKNVFHFSENHGRRICNPSNKKICTFWIIEGFCIAMRQMKLEGKSFKMMYNVR
jgi:endonuclease III